MKGGHDRDYFRWLELVRPVFSTLCYQLEGVDLGEPKLLLLLWIGGAHLQHGVKHGLHLRVADFVAENEPFGHRLSLLSALGVFIDDDPQEEGKEKELAVDLDHCGWQSFYQSTKSA